MTFGPRGADQTANAANIRTIPGRGYPRLVSGPQGRRAPLTDRALRAQLRKDSAHALTNLDDLAEVRQVRAELDEVSPTLGDDPRE